MYGNVVQRSAPAAEPISLAEAKVHCRAESDFTDDDALISGLISAARGHVETATSRMLVLRLLRATFPALPCELEMRTPARAVSGIQYLDDAADPQTLDSDLCIVDLAATPATIIQAFDATWPTTYQHPAAVTLDYSCGHAVPFTANASTDVLASANHPYADGDAVRVVNSGGALPSGLAVNTTYYVVSSAAGTLKLSASVAGAAINLTDAGTGINFLLTEDDSAWTAMRQAMLLLIGHWYNNRESVQIGAAPTEVPMAVDMLLAPHKVWGV